MGKIEVEHCDFVHVHEDIVKDVREHMPDVEKLQELADFFKVFGDSTRIRILCILLCGEMCVCDLAQTLDMTQSAITQHLRVHNHM